jgi:predicted alternative tryptophan synthase beta-subunit
VAQDPNSPSSLGIAISEAVEAYHHVQFEDYEYPAEKVDEAMHHLPKETPGKRLLENG